MNNKGQTILKNSKELKQVAYYFRFNNKEEVEKCKNMLKNK